MSDPAPPPAYKTLLGRLVIDATFRESFVIDPRGAVAQAGILDVDEERLVEIEGLGIAERSAQVKEALNRFHANRWAGWWGMEMLDPEPGDE